MFAGNIGEAQDFASIIDASKLLKDKKIFNGLYWEEGERNNG